MLSFHPLAPAHPLDMLMQSALHDAIAMPVARAHLTRLGAPQPRLSETEDGAYEISLAAPGVSPNDLTIEATNGRLTIKGETRTAAHTHFVNYSVALPEDADADAASATSTDGLLTVALPKIAKPEPAKIAISTSAPIEEEAETDEATRPYKLTLVAAGLAPTDVEITAEAANVLFATGETKRTGARLHRRFKLPRDADAPSATATCVDGLLTIAVPKRAKTAAKTLVVNAPVSEQKPTEAATAGAKMTVTDAATADEAEDDGDAVMVSP